MSRRLMTLGTMLSLVGCTVDRGGDDVALGAGLFVDDDGLTSVNPDEVPIVAAPCGDGEVAVRSGTGWVCAIVEGGTIVAACPRLHSADDLTRSYILSSSVSGYTLCVSGADEMVKVGSFWIDKYEAVLVNANVWNDGGCNGTGTPAELSYYASGGGLNPTDDYPAEFPDHGNWTPVAAMPPVYACSISGQYPSRLMTWFQAAQACAISGKRLCTNGEWQTAAAGTYDPGVWSGSSTSSGRCLGGSTDGPRKTAMAGASAGGDTSCMSRWGAEDMIGNLWEITADWTAGGPANLDMGDDQDYYPWPATYGPAPGNGGAVRNLDSRASPDGAGTFTPGLPAMVLRGGDWDGGQRNGQFAYSARFGPNYTRRTVGVRCCAD